MDYSAHCFSSTVTLGKHDREVECIFKIESHSFKNIFKSHNFKNLCYRNYIFYFFKEWRAIQGYIVVYFYFLR